MILSEEQRKEYEHLVRPLMEFLGKHAHPHVEVTVSSTHAELAEGCYMFRTEDYIYE